MHIQDLKPGMVVSVRDTAGFYPRCLVVTSSRPDFKLRFVSLEGYYWVRPFFDGDEVEVVE